MDEATIKARMQGEMERTLGNIVAEVERPSTAFWLSFADDDGFRGAVIVHANDFLEAIMRCNLEGINPHGECQGREIPLGSVLKIPERWKNRILSREDCVRFDAEMMEAQAGV
jgi:hypothetical protein